MRAVVQYEFGGPEVLTLIHDAPIPEPIPTEVQVRVSHAGSTRSTERLVAELP